MYSLLSPLAGITQKLQGRGLDVYEAHKHVRISIDIAYLVIVLVWSCMFCLVCFESLFKYKILMQISETVSYYEKLREEETSTFYEMALNMAKLVDVAPVMPRVCGRMVNRGNISADSTSSYYEVNVYLPLLDHLLSELRTRFTCK